MQLVLLSPFGISISILMTAILIDVLFGDPPTAFHPVGWQGNFISFFWDLRPAFNFRGLFLYGLSIVIIGFLITLGLVGLLQLGLWKLAVAGDRPLYPILSIVLAALLMKGSFSHRNLLAAGALVQSSIRGGDITEARRLVSYHLVSRPVDNLESPEIVSAVIESLAENFTDSLVAPLFWYALGGPAGAWCYRYVNTADAMLGYRDGDKEWGGKAAARLDDVLSWIPARFAGWLITIATLPAGLDARRAARVMLSDARHCASPNSGWTMSAAAGALGVRLEKKGNYVLNSGGRMPEETDIGRLRRLLRWSLILTIPPVLIVSTLVFVLLFTLLPGG